MRQVLAFLSTILVAIVPSLARAQWLYDGTRVVSQSVFSINSAIPDGAGGIIIAWMDYRTSNIDIRAQRAKHFDHVVYDREGLKAQKVNLHKSDLLNDLHVVLGQCLTLFPAIEGKVFGQMLVRYDDAGGVRRGVPGEAFEGRCIIEEHLYLGVGAVKLLQLGVVGHGLFQVRRR